MARQVPPLPEFVFALGQKVAVYDECENHTGVEGVIEGAQDRDGEEFYEVRMPDGRVETLSEMRLTDA